VFSKKLKTPSPLLPILSRPDQLGDGVTIRCATRSKAMQVASPKA